MRNNGIIDSGRFSPTREFRKCYPQLVQTDTEEYLTGSGVMKVILSQIWSLLIASHESVREQSMRDQFRMLTNKSVDLNCEFTSEVKR